MILGFVSFIELIRIVLQRAELTQHIEQETPYFLLPVDPPFVRLSPTNAPPAQECTTQAPPTESHRQLKALVQMSELVQTVAVMQAPLEDQIPFAKEKVCWTNTCVHVRSYSLFACLSIELAFIIQLSKPMRLSFVYCDPQICSFYC